MTPPRETTLLRLVTEVQKEAATDAEVVATVMHLLRSGRVRLIGTFRDMTFRPYRTRRRAHAA